MIQIVVTPYVAYCITTQDHGVYGMMTQNDDLLHDNE